MFNATLLCITSFIYIRGIFDKAIVNLLPCFSWHFWKRSLPWLQAERGTDLGHLLFVMLLYSFSIYLQRGHGARGLDCDTTQSKYPTQPGEKGSRDIGPEKTERGGTAALARRPPLYSDDAPSLF